MNGYTPKIQLPFTTAKPFPAQAFEPSPERLRMGVEAQARANAPKMPVVNTAVSDRIAALGRNPNVPTPAESAGPRIPLPRTAPAGTMPTRPASMPVNPLSRNAPAGAASSLGGPVPVGPQRAPGERALRIAARRGNIDAARTLYQADQRQGSEGAYMRFQAWRDGQQAEQRNQERTQERTWQEQDRAQGRSWQTQDQEAERRFRAWQESKDTNQRQQERGQARDWQVQDQERERQQQLEDEKRRSEEARKTYPLMDPTTGKPSSAHFMTGNGMTLPTSKPEAPLPPGMVPKQAQRDGIMYGPADQVDKPQLPDGIQYEKDLNGKIVSAVYPTWNPDSKSWTLARMDLNGDGVVSESEKAAATTGSGSAGSAAGQTGSGIKFKMK